MAPVSYRNAAALAGLETALQGKALVDCTNPVGAGLTHPLPSGSGSERVQQIVPTAKVGAASRAPGSSLD